MEKKKTSLVCWLGNGMEIGAGTVLLAIMILTVIDIVGRTAGHPVSGTYEVVSVAGGLIVGLALPNTSRARAHVYMDILILRLPSKVQSVLMIMTRSLSMILFGLAGLGMIMMGGRLKTAGEVTAVLSLPFYCVAYALGGAFWLQTLLLGSDVAEILRGRHE